MYTTHLKDYGLGEDAVDKIVKQLEGHGMTQLGENGDITPEVAREIFNACLIISRIVYILEKTPGRCLFFVHCMKNIMALYTFYEYHNLV